MTKPRCRHCGVELPVPSWRTCDSRECAQRAYRRAYEAKRRAKGLTGRARRYKPRKP